MPRKGVIPPQFLKHPPRSWKGDMPRVKAEARADTRKRGSRMPRRRTSRRYEYRARTRRSRNEKIGVVPAAIEVGGLLAGGSEALNGNLTGGATIFLGSMIASWAVKKLGKHTMLHKLGVKMGRKKELTVV